MANLENDRIADLAERARNGDREAFSRIVDQLMNSVVALTHKMTGDRDTALDLAQETFVAAWTGLGEFRKEARFQSWLYRIAMNKCLNHMHSANAARKTELSEFEGSSRLRPDLMLDQRELESGILEFMTLLPEQQKVAFELRFYRHMTFEEIAAATGKAIGTVKTNYREAISKLRGFAVKKGLHP